MALTACTAAAVVSVASSPSFRLPSSSRASSSFSLSQSVVPQFPRLLISHRRKRSSYHVKKVPTIWCKLEEKFEAEGDSSKEASIDLKLPRRSLLVSFTCNACDVRSQRLINRLAYERGTIFLQCSGCLKYHKFVDNLGLVVEYNLLEDSVSDSNPN